MSWWGPDWVSLAPNGTNLNFLRSVSVPFGAVRQKVLQLIFKNPRFVVFGANLTQFEANPEIPVDLTPDPDSFITSMEHAECCQVNTTSPPSTWTFVAWLRVRAGSGRGHQVTHTLVTCPGLIY